MISVVIPMYNSESTIEKCVNSVIKQSFDKLIEIVLVNDGSKDRTLEIVSRLAEIATPNRILKIIDKPNGGVSSARNAGIRSATQEWIALLDSDDEWLAEKLELQFDWLKRNPEISFLGTSFNNYKHFSWVTKNKQSFELTPLSVILKWWPYPSTMVFRRDIITFHNAFFNENLRRGEDGYFIINLLQKIKIFSLTDSTVVAGGGKRTFGASGLSADLARMFKGEITILKFAFENRQINHFQFVFLRTWLTAKYLRRIIITKLF